MELIYLYIEDDGRNIKDCEFNFSPEYRFHYDKEENSLSIEKNENYISNFWEAEKILNITALIGKNGSGKSNLIELIFRLTSSPFGIGGYGNKGRFIYVYRSNGKFITNNILADFQIKNYFHLFNNLSERHSYNTDTRLLYYSPHYEKHVSNYGELKYTQDLSNGGILRKYGKERAISKGKGEKFIETFSDIERLIIEDTFRQIDLFSTSKTDYFDSISLPSALQITFETGANRLDTDHPVYNSLYINKTLQELSFVEHIQNRILYFLFKEKKYIDSIELKDDISFNDFIKQTPYYDFYNELVNLNNKRHIIFKKYPQQLGSRDYPLLFFIKRENLSSAFIKGLYSYYSKGSIGISSSAIFDALGILHSNLTLKWIGISAGELEYFNLLARIYTSLSTGYVNETRKEVKNVMLLLDEPENAFHPEWQRLFLNNFIRFLQKSFPSYYFQIIIASHSPILVSDFPKNNIIFLDKDEFGNCKVVPSINQENTFGANIHTLYRNSFFLEGIPIGEFAKKKINKLFKELQNEQTINDGILTEIQLIGEPLIRDQLIKLYNQKKGLPENTERRIKKMEEEIKILKSRLNDKN